MLGIEFVRLELNMSRAEFGEKLGVAPHTVFRWERGERNPNLDILRKISSMSGKSIDYLINPTPPSEAATGPGA